MLSLVHWGSLKVTLSLNWQVISGGSSNLFDVLLPKVMRHTFVNVHALFFFFLLNNVLKLMSSCPLLSLQFAPSSPVGCTPSLDSTTRSPWTPWPRSAAPCTPPLSHPVTPPIMRCSLSSRCAPPSGVLSSAYSLTTSGRSSSTSTTPSEVGDKASLESGL